jgi:hypothetical protein
VSIRSSKWLTKFYIMYQFKSVNPSSRHVSQAQIGATLKNWILAMFLKPFVADRWILVSLPSPNGEVVVAVFGSRGAVAAASMPVWAQAVWGCLEVGRHEGQQRSAPLGAGWRRRRGRVDAGAGGGVGSRGGAEPKTESKSK